MAREVVLYPYDDAWPGLFGAERKRLLNAAPAAVLDIEHIGSTSVPGLTAKPIIDVLVTLSRFFNADEIAAICPPGHEYRGIDEDQRQYFSKRAAPAFHIHCYLPGSAHAERLLLFRDYLRAHPDAAGQYERLKYDLAARYRYDRYAYTDAKAQFVRTILETPQEWRRQTMSTGS